MATPAPNPIAMLLQQVAARGGAPGGPGGPPPGPGGPLGGPPPGPGGPPGMDQMIPGLGVQPSPGGEAAAMKQAASVLGFAMTRFATRAPDVAKELATALVHVRKAMDKSATLLQSEIAPPPPGIPGGGGFGNMAEPGAMAGGL